MILNIVTLSKIQFAFAVMFHFLFVPLTLGLSILIAIMESMYVKTGDETYLKMTKFWGKLFLINFALGVVTGITLEFQFGTNWGEFSSYVGDIFASVLAIEILAAFFLESSMIGIWTFGWNKISKKAHMIVAWLIAFASNFSAVWILIANAWMQHPVGYELRNGRAELVDLSQIITQKYAILEITHTLPASYLLAAFFVLSICAYHFLKGRSDKILKKSFNIASLFGLFSVFLLLLSGHFNGVNVAKVQPSKFAAMENHWNTEKNASVYLFSLPDEKNEKSIMEFGRLKGLLSMMAFNNPNSTVKGLKEFSKEERPPVFLVYTAFRIMVMLGTYFIAVFVFAYFKRKTIQNRKVFLKILLFSLPLPYIAIQLGWVVTEVGRQPWVVFNLLKTQNAVSYIALSQVLTSLVFFVLIYAFIGFMGFYLIYKNATKLPE